MIELAKLARAGSVVGWEAASREWEVRESGRLRCLPFLRASTLDLPLTRLVTDV